MKQVKFKFKSDYFMIKQTSIRRKSDCMLTLTVAQPVTHQQWKWSTVDWKPAVDNVFACCSLRNFEDRRTWNCLLMTKLSIRDKYDHRSRWFYTQTKILSFVTPNKDRLAKENSLAKISRDDYEIKWCRFCRKKRLIAVGKYFVWNRFQLETELFCRTVF